MPPGTPGGVVFTQHGVYVAMRAEGDVSDFDALTVGGIRSAFAAAASVGTSAVDVHVSPGSVVLEVRINTVSSSRAAAVSAALSTSLADPALATAFFASYANVTVQTTPHVEPTAESFVTAVPPSAPPEPFRLSSGAITGIVLGSLAGAMVVGALLIGGVLANCRGDPAKKQAKQVVVRRNPAAAAAHHQDNFA